MFWPCGRKSQKLLVPVWIWIRLCVSFRFIALFWSNTSVSVFLSGCLITQPNLIWYLIEDMWCFITQSHDSNVLKVSWLKRNVKSFVINTLNMMFHLSPPPLCRSASRLMWPAASTFFHPSARIREAMASALQAAGGLTSVQTLMLCVLSLLLLQPADSSAAPDTRTWSQTGPRLQLSHSGRKHISSAEQRDTEED